jgi:hypothetical protein
MFRDSLDKIVTSYFAAMAETPLNYNGAIIHPKKLVVSPLIFRGYTCPPICGGCCFKFSLVYLPAEVHPYKLTKKIVRFNDRDVLMYEDIQDDNKGVYCRNLDRTSGRCNIHGRHPFSCDFELMRVLSFDDHYQLTQKLYGRGWNMKRVDGGKGALCEMVAPDSFSVEEVIRKLYRLGMWCAHFGVQTTRIQKILAWAQSQENSKPLTLGV